MAYYELLCDRMTFKEEVVQKYCFDSNSVPEDFDGMGLLHVKTEYTLLMKVKLINLFTELYRSC